MSIQGSIVSSVNSLANLASLRFSTEKAKTAQDRVRTTKTIRTQQRAQVTKHRQSLKPITTVEEAKKALAKAGYKDITTGGKK